MAFDPTFIADVCARMLAGPRYLGPDQIGADIQLQQFVLDWERGNPNDLTRYVDRHRSYDVLLQQIAARFIHPVIVETGCIRGEEDWRGTGFGTYLLGAFTDRYGGEVISVDIEQGNCEFARRTTGEVKTVTVVNQDSVEFLQAFNQPIDVLILDSMDTWIPGCEEHALREVQAALPWLHERSIIVLDDTVYKERRFTGKGALSVPWLLEQGWQILYSGYQTICVLRGKEAMVECASSY